MTISSTQDITERLNLIKQRKLGYLTYEEYLAELGTTLKEVKPIEKTVKKWYRLILEIDPSNNTARKQRIKDQSILLQNTGFDNINGLELTSNHCNKADAIPFPDIAVTGAPAPNALIRSSVFGVVKRGARKQYTIQNIEDSWPTLASWKDTKIQFLGFQLDQADLDTWLSLIELAKQHGFGATVSATAYEILKISGKKDTGQTRTWLTASLDRLFLGRLKIQINSCSYRGSFIDSIAEDGLIGNDGKYHFTLNKRLMGLFKSGTTALSIEHRRQLKGDLVKWLSSYIASHAITKSKPHKISISKLQKLCGSESLLKKFKQNLQKATVALNNVEKYKTSIEKGQTNEDLFVVRVP
ncbi:replication initiator protein A [Piscirickettsia litoralis]|uniref:Replication protein n=1 Tax=Piscirickettsia litoralis TaxID=1891921 RepID=A0ABX3A0K0_9GAMM|nr:replication initiator protein A [Piscirickettsia litoralis]ODN40990.1 hypothetical protein BGC07_18725 [Piscirickettsia litoralis]